MKNMNQTTRWLLRAPEKKKAYVYALTLLQAVSGSIGVFYALLLRAIVDSAVAGQAEKLRHHVILIIALIAFQLALAAVIRWLRELAKSSIENVFKERLLGGILRKDFAQVSAVHSAEWLNRLTNDVTVVTNGYVDILPGLGGMVVRLLSAFIMILAIDKWFIGIFVPGGALLIVCTWIFRGVLKRMHKKIQESDGQLRIYLQEHISNLMLIKSYGGEPQTARGAAEKMEAHKAARMRRNRFSNLCNIGFGAAMQGMVLTGVIYCAYGILSGSVTYGTMTAIMHLTAQIQAPLANLTGFIPQWYAMTASAERLMEAESFSDEEACADMAEVLAYYDNRFQELGLQDAAFAYEKEGKKDVRPGEGDLAGSPEESGGNKKLTVLRHFDFSIQKGEFVALTGPSGCGKSTVLKLLMCLYPLDAGKRYFDDQPLTARFRRLFAYVPQGNALMNGRIRDIISFADPDAAYDDKRLQAALRIACADSFVSDLDAVLGERGSGLSEGQMQRIAIARAIFSSSPILLLDEATSALDETTEKQLLENLRQLTNKTVVIVTHRKAALEYCDRVVETS